jgi:hypothetical protein
MESDSSSTSLNEKTPLKKRSEKKFVVVSKEEIASRRLPIFLKCKSVALTVPNHMREMIQNKIERARNQTPINFTPEIISFTIIHGTYKNIVNPEAFEKSEQYLGGFDHLAISDDQLVVDMQSCQSAYMAVMGIILYLRTSLMHTVIHRQSLKLSLVNRLTTPYHEQQSFYYNLFVNFVQCK